MQYYSKKVICLAIGVVVLIFGMAGLMMIDVPAQQKPVEIQLDAKAFTDQK